MSNPGRTLGRYELITRIGEGGMAEVYLARQRGPRAFEKLVVVKTVHPRLASKTALAEALLEEARIAAKVRHPHVVDIYDLGEEDGTYFIAMEYLEGESMTSIIRAQRAKGGERLPPLRTAQVVADCAAGLHAAHELKSLAGEPLELVHQDVTPGNVFVLYTGQAKLLDFGVAKVRSTADADLVKGKAGYLAPELFEKHRADRRSDVFALGVVLWESLTLRRLFGGGSDAESFAKIRACDVVAPSTHNPAVPPELDAICLRALTKSRDDRYQTARAMQEELKALLRGADRNDYEGMAAYMRKSFASQIAVRQQLLRELDAGGTVGATTLEAITATFGDQSPADGGAVVESAPVEARSADDKPAEGKAAGKKLAPLPAPRRVLPLPSIARARTGEPTGSKPAGGSAVAPSSEPSVIVEASAPAASPTPPAEAPAAPAATESASSAQAAAPAPEPAGPAGPPPVPASLAVVRAEAAEDDDDELLEPSGLVEVPDPPMTATAGEVRSTPVAEVATDDRSSSDELPPIAPAPSRRVWIGAGLGAVAVTIIVVALTARGSSSSKRAAAPPDPEPVALADVDAAVEPLAIEVQPDAAAPTIDAGVVEPDAATTAVVEPRNPPRPDEPRKPNPARAAALAQQGLQAFMSGDTSGAITRFRDALREDPSHAAAQRGLGLAYEKRGDKARAARAFRAYLSLAPNARDAAAIRAKLDKL